MRDQALADPGQTHGIESVQRREFAVGIPPFRGHGLEAGDLGGIDAGSGRERDGFGHVQPEKVGFGRAACVETPR
jgi:hypothetical protein